MDSESIGFQSRRRGPEARALRMRTLYYGAALVLAALVPMILFAGLWFRSELRKGQQDIDTYLGGRASALSQRLDALVQQQLAALQAIAALPSLDVSDLSYFHNAAERMAPAMGWSAIELFEPEQGRQLLNTARPLGTELPALAPEILGRVVQSRHRVVETREPGPDGLHPERVIHLYLPVLREGAVRYVLAAALRASLVGEILSSEISDPRLLAAVIDERGQLLARSREPGFGQAIADEDVKRAVQRSPLTGWLAVVGADPERFDQLSRQSGWAVAGTGAVSLTLAGVLAIFLLYNLMEGRLNEERLRASAALGDLDARLLKTTQEALGEQRKAASEREVLLREIYHRVKNNLQIVQSLLRLGSRELSAVQREPFEDAIRRIGAMARVHTLIYNSPDFASIDMSDYLRGLVGEIAEASHAGPRRIVTKVEAEPMQVSLDTAVPLAFIAVELLTNAFKHAFPADREGTITVSCRRESGSGVLTVADDGIGVPAEAPGRRSLGLTIVRKLTEQIGATLERPDNGLTAFQIRFPLEAAKPVPEPGAALGSAPPLIAAEPPSISEDAGQKSV